MYDYTIGDEKVLNIADFDDSFNVVFGINTKAIDLFDNPYFSYNVYDLTHHWAPKISDTVKL